MTVLNTYVATRSIGGSDVAAIIGCNKYQSVHDVWTRLCRPDLVAPRVDNAAMEQGRFLEPLILAKYAAETEQEVELYTSDDPVIRAKGRVYHPEYPFLHATLDGRIVGGVRAAVDGPGVIDGKSFGIGNFKKVKAQGADGIDEMYHAQLQHYMFVDNRSWGAFAAFGREDWKLIPLTIERDEAMIGLIVDKVVHFWNDYVLTEKRPPEEEFKIAFPRAPEAKVEVVTDADYVKLMTQLKSVRGEMALQEQQEEMIIETLKGMMGDRTHLTIPGAGKISWSESTQRRLDVCALKIAHPEIDFKLYEKIIATRPFRPTFSK